MSVLVDLSYFFQVSILTRFHFAIFRYGDVEQELQELSRPQGYSVDDVVELVRINEETMDMMRVSVSFFV